MQQVNELFKPESKGGTYEPERVEHRKVFAAGIDHPKCLNHGQAANGGEMPRYQLASFGKGHIIYRNCLGRTVCSCGADDCWAQRTYYDHAVERLLAYPKPPPPPLPDAITKVREQTFAELRKMNQEWKEYQIQQYRKEHHVQSV